MVSMAIVCLPFSIFISVGIDEHRWALTKFRCKYTMYKPVSFQTNSFGRFVDLKLSKFLKVSLCDGLGHSDFSEK